MYKDRIAQYEKQHGGTSYASKSRKDDDDNETGVWPFANWDLSEPDEAAGTPNNGWNPFEGNKSSLSGRPSGWSLGDGPAAFQLWDDTSNETDGAPSPRNGNPWDPPVAESNPNLTKSKEHSSTAKRNRRTESDRVKFSTNPRNTRSHDWSSYHNNRQDTSPGGENDLWRTFDSSHRTTTAKSGNNYGIGLRPVCSRLAHGTALPPPATLKLQQMCQRCEET